MITEDKSHEEGDDEKSGTPDPQQKDNKEEKQTPTGRLVNIGAEICDDV